MTNKSPTSVKISPPALRLIKRAARLRGVGVSEYIRETVSAKAIEDVSAYSKECPTCGTLLKRESAA